MLRLQKKENLHKFNSDLVDIFNFDKIKLHVNSVLKNSIFHKDEKYSYHHYFYLLLTPIL